jgi:hypothetical protein
MEFSNKKHQTKAFKFLLAFLLVFFVATSTLADFTSTSFELENPSTMVIEGGQSSSTSFQYLSSTGQLDQGQSTSTSFAQNAGFLYFPTATSPVVSATAGNAEVTLSWTASTGIFANITSYSVGISTSSGGTYTFTNVGNVLTSIRTSLTNGTTYYFKIRSFAAGIYLSESAVVSSTPVAPAGGGSGGGSGGGGPVSSTKVIFFGKAYPNSSVTLLKDAQIVASTIAGGDANFNMQLNNLTAGSYIFSVYSTDKDSIRSPIQSFPITVTEGVTINVGGIFIAPTISGDKSEVKQGDNITFFGQSVPKSEVTIAVHSNQEIFKKVQSDVNGVYLHTMDTSPLDIGTHNAKSKVAFQSQISAYSNGYNFTVGDENIGLTKDKKCPGKGDLNSDCRVNLVDFSIAAYWYKKPLNAQTIILEKEKLNGDKNINLVDFSIMAYYWTG